MNDDSTPDRIELRGLRVLGVHGALPEEQDRAQPFEIDLDVEADLSVAGASDRLADTVDYGALAAVVAAVVGGERFRLLERLAERLADGLADADPRIRAVTVSVRKLRPPVPVDLTSAGVRITRRRPAAGAPPREPVTETAARTTESVTGPEGRGEPVTESDVRAIENVTGSGARRGRRRVFLGLGSNLGDRMATLRQAVAGLPEVAAVSPVYETEPVGGPDGQPPYLNVVVELVTGLSPRQLLDIAHRLESVAGRERTERFGPRTLDVDVLLVGDEAVDEPDLTVPHPRMLERRFVLAPLADLAPEMLPPGWDESALGHVTRVGRLDDDDRHPPSHLLGPEREETT